MFRQKELAGSVDLLRSVFGVITFTHATERNLLTLYICKINKPNQLLIYYDLYLCKICLIHFISFFLELTHIRGFWVFWELPPIVMNNKYLIIPNMQALFAGTCRF